MSRNTRGRYKHDIYDYIITTDNVEYLKGEK